MPGTEPTEIMLTYIEACKGTSCTPTLEHNPELMSSDSAILVCIFRRTGESSSRCVVQLSSPTVSRVHYLLNQTLSNELMIIKLKEIQIRGIYYHLIC